MMTNLAAPEYTIGRCLPAAEGNAIRLLATGPGCVSGLQANGTGILASY